MKNSLLFICTIALMVITGCSEKNPYKTPESSIFPNGRKIDNDNFHGIAWLKMLAESDSLNPMYAGNVRFESGSRTNWHSHPAGQLLIVIEGEGYYQEKGQAKRILRKGDAVKCPPDTPHWHGATPKNEFEHIAISSSQNGSTQWLHPVSKDEYNAGE